VVTDSGKVQWQHAIDVSRIAIIGQVAAALVVLAVLLTRRHRVQVAGRT
jgi:hypothetical protein